MKTRFPSTMLLAFILIFCSCSSDDDSTSNSSLEGTWMLNSLSIETAFDFNNDGTASRNLFEETPCYDNDFVNFDSEGGARVVTALTYIYAEVNSPTDYQYLYQCEDGFDVDTSWTQDGDTVTIIFGGNALVGTISGNTMTVNIPDFFEIEMYNGADYFDVSEDVTLIYTKA